MAGYNEIRGLRVKYLSADPSNAEDGQVWYNNTSGTLRVQGIGTSTWSSSGNLPVGNTATSMFGTQNAAIMAGGQALSPGPAPTANTLEYGGLSWISLPTLASGARKHLAGCGTTTAGVVFGGTPPVTANTEEWNGSSWSEQNNMGTARYKNSPAQNGVQTAALSVGGTLGSSPYQTNNVEEYDGSSWTAVTVLPATVNQMSGIGIQTAYLGVGGSPYLTAGFEYDGTNWTAGGSLSVGTNGAGSCGTQTAGMIFGGRVSGPSRLNTTQKYNGSSWSADPATLSTGTSNLQNVGAGSNTAASMAGGSTTTTLATTQEYNFTKDTITPAAWSSGGNMGTARYGGNYFGTGKESQVAVAGNIATPTAVTSNSETYSGTSWSEGNNINTTRFNAAGGGTETAGIVATGRNPLANPSPQVRYGNTEEYNGTSYSEVNACPEASYRKVGAGTQTALMICGGLPSSFPPYANTSFEYDGTNWTAGGAMPQRGDYMDGVGVTTAAVIFGAINSPSPTNNACLDYDGSSFSANNNMNIAHGGQHSACGTTTSALVVCGGGPYGVSAAAEIYDGTSFTTNATTATSGQRGGKGTSSPASIVVGGYGGSPGSQFLTATEEYSVGSTTTGPASNITTS